MSNEKFTDYKSKTNRWIAIEVARRLGKRVSVVTEFHDGDGCVIYPHSNQVNFDPCNVHDDAYPIVEEFGMVLIVDGTACIPKLRIKHKCSDNVLRAAMICFLMMKDAENE